MAQTAIRLLKVKKLIKFLIKSTTGLDIYEDESNADSIADQLSKVHVLTLNLNNILFVYLPNISFVLFGQSCRKDCFKKNRINNFTVSNIKSSNKQTNKQTC